MHLKRFEKYFLHDRRRFGSFTKLGVRVIHGRQTLLEIELQTQHESLLVAVVHDHHLSVPAKEANEIMK